METVCDAWFYLLGYLLIIFLICFIENFDWEEMSNMKDGVSPQLQYKWKCYETPSSMLDIHQDRHHGILTLSMQMKKSGNHVSTSHNLHSPV